MKCLVVSFLLFLGIAAILGRKAPKETPAPPQFEEEPLIDRYSRLLLDCTRHHGVSLQDYVHATRTQTFEGIYGKTKCVDACMFKDLQILNENGTIHVENALEHLVSKMPEVNATSMRASIVECSERKGHDDCDTAHKLMGCVFKSY